MGHIVTTFLLDNSLNTAIVVVFALLPILWLIISLGIFKLPAHIACTLGLTFSLLIAVTYFQMPAILAIKAVGEGMMLAILPILWVILATFYTYNISLKTGAMAQIKSSTTSLSGDRRMQALTIAWGFGGFLETVAGFGTAVAIPASILISLGFKPFLAAVVYLLAILSPSPSVLSEYRSLHLLK
ncbi:Glycolate permease GlcA [Sporomusa aerivorans]